MSIIQLNPPVPLTVEGKGKGYAMALIDYGQEHSLIWVTAIDDTGEIWCAPNHRVRMQGNWTMSRMLPAGRGDHPLADDTLGRMT